MWVPVIVWEPSLPEAGEYVTEQLEAVVLIVLSAQEVKLVEVESRVKLTEPVGVVDAEDVGESITVAVQGRPTLTRTDGEAQDKLVTVV